MHLLQSAIQAQAEPRPPHKAPHRGQEVPLQRMRRGLFSQ
ncbi:hypothetical protein LEMLEM_LOCUS7228 [Lemmus lemmus]